MKNTKKFTIFAGVNGAGKSTLFSSEAKDDLGIRLNADEILRSLKLNWEAPNTQILAGSSSSVYKKTIWKRGFPSIRKQL